MVNLSDSKALPGSCMILPVLCVQSLQTEQIQGFLHTGIHKEHRAFWDDTVLVLRRRINATSFQGKGLLTHSDIFSRHMWQSERHERSKTMDLFGRFVSER
jgi:hypothetical protein